MPTAIKKIFVRILIFIMLMLPFKRFACAFNRPARSIFANFVLRTNLAQSRTHSTEVPGGHKCVLVAVELKKKVDSQTDFTFKESVAEMKELVRL